MEQSGPTNSKQQDKIAKLSQQQKIITIDKVASINKNMSKKSN